MTFIYLSKQLFYRLLDLDQIFKEKGFRTALSKLTRTVARIFYQRAEYVVLANTLSEYTNPTKPGSGLVIRQATTLEEISGLSLIADSADIARFHKQFNNGGVAFIAFQNDQAVGYCWISQKTDQGVNRLQAALRLHRADAYIHDLYTSPAHRGRGIGQALVSHRLQYLREHGYERAVAAVYKDNVPALKLNKKMEYELIAELRHTRILFWDHYRYLNHD